MERLNEIIKSVWDNKIENDFRNSCILNEDTLKNAFYCHLRNEMERCGVVVALHLSFIWCC